VSLDERGVRVLVVTALVGAGAGAWALASAIGGPTDPEPVPTSPPSALAPGDPDRVLLEGFDEIAVTVDPGDGGDRRAWCLLAALDAQQRARGLMEVTDLRGYEGMAFVYEQDVSNGFHMAFTPMPLSIAWVAADGQVVTVKDMEPCDSGDGCPSYPSEGSYRYAIEVPQGDLPELGISMAATVQVGGPCAPRT
jgi:uncharacterized membrane protein (UPF0127 family)